MAKDRITKFRASEFSTIHVRQPSSFDDKYYRQIGMSTEKVEEQRVAHQQMVDRVRTIQFGDPDSQRNLYAQTISAVYTRPLSKIRGVKFEPFGFFREPGSDRFLVGDIEGDVDHEKRVFTFRALVINDVRDSIAEMRALSSAMQHFNPGVPKVASASFSAAMMAESTD